MAQRNLNTGTVANDGTGDSIRVAGNKMNDNFIELYATSAVQSQIGLAQNEITSNVSNADIVLKSSGVGTVSVNNLIVDSNVKITDNVIETTSSNSDLVLEGSSSGTVAFANVDINGGAIDNTVIGASTPAAASFTTVVSPVFNSDNITISDNNITTSSNADLQFTANGTGHVKISGLELPNADGNFGQVLSTNGSGTLTFVSSPVLFEHTNITDGTVTLSGSTSAVQEVDSFNEGQFRAVKYHLQISDATANRFTLQDLNVINDDPGDSSGGLAFIANYGGVSNVAGYFPVDFTVDTSSGRIRLLGSVNNTNNQVIKFVRREIHL